MTNVDEFEDCTIYCFKEPPSEGRQILNQTLQDDDLSQSRDSQIKRRSSWNIDKDHDLINIDAKTSLMSLFSNSRYDGKFSINIYNVSSKWHF